MGQRDLNGEWGMKKGEAGKVGSWEAGKLGSWEGRKPGSWEGGKLGSSKQ